MRFLPPSIRWTSVALIAASFACGGDGPTGPVLPPAAAPVNEVQFDVAEVALYVGQVRSVGVTAKDASGATLSGRTVAWASADAAVASVSSSGVVTALAPGTALISATIEGKSAALPVTVSLVPVNQVIITLPAASIYVGGTMVATASPSDSAGNFLTGRVAAWTSSNAAVLTVSGAGVITGIAPGTATVTAIVEGKTATATVTVQLVPVATVTVSPATSILYLGGTADLAASAKDSVGNTLTGRSITWSTSSSAVATVSSTGLVTATAAGTATVTATVEGKVGTATITAVVVPVSTVTLSAGNASLYPGATLDYDASALDSAGNPLTGRAISWTSSNTLIATVSSTGLVTAIAPGTAVITATVEGKTASATITVQLVPVATVTVSPATSILYLGGTADLAASAKDSVGNALTGRSITWSTSRSAVAAVSSTGLVAAIAAGTATITATVEGKVGTATITAVVVPVSTVTLSAGNASLYPGSTLDYDASALDSAGTPLTGRVITWTSSNTSIATVSSTGLVTAIAPGTAVITATVEGKAASATITVQLVPVATVTVSPATSTLYVGQAVGLGAATKDSAGNTLTGRTITWSTSSSSVATVSSAGLVTAIATGAATLTATAEGKTGTAAITVAVVPVASVVLSSGDASLYPTSTLDYDASALDSAGNPLTGRAITWSSSNAGVATISTTGLVSAVAQGTASITATVEGKTATATITVRHDPIIFVHGFASSPSVWSTMTGRFAADGWRSADLVAWSYNSLQSNVTTASSLNVTVDSLLAATGAKRVDIITHSMGGLSSRYYMKNLGGSSKVDAWVSLGGPNHGTDTAPQCAGTYTSCAEMVIGSAFLTTLNSTDETPGPSRYATWWSPCDTTINPDDTVALVGATNTQTACLGHSVLYSDLTVYGQVQSWVR